MNKFRLIFLICFIGILNSQSMADLDNLPPEIRKSVLERMEKQNSSIDSTISPEIEESDDDIDEYIEYLKSEDEEIEFDEYGSEIVKRFGYDLFEDISDQTPLEVKAAPANYILGPGDELRFNFSGSIKKTIDSTNVALISNTKLEKFIVTRSTFQLANDSIFLPQSTFDLLNLKEGDKVALNV